MSLAKKTANGMLWTSTSTIIRSLVSLFQIAVLTRYLTKEDFGTLAIASVFIGFTQLFLDLGVSIGIMHKQEISRKEYSSLFWFNIFSGVILTIFLIIISPWIAGIYNDNDLTPILMLLSISIFFAALGSQHRTVQQKMMRFKFIAIIEIISSLITAFTAVILAIYGFGVYSLVISTLLGVAISNILFLIIGLSKDNNVYFHFKLSETYQFLKIGIFSVGSSILDYLSRELDVIFISSSFGKETLGVYSLCKKIVQMLYGIINPIITKILTPLFSILQTDRNKIKKVYLTLIETLAIVNLPAYVLVSIFARSILLTVYGESYISGTFVLSVLALYYGILSLSNPIGSLQIAFGRTDIGFYWTVYRISITLLAVYISSFYNIEVLVLLFLLISIINTLLIWSLQLKLMIKIKFKEYINSFIKPVLFISILSLPFYYFLWEKSSIYLSVSAAIVFMFIYGITLNGVHKDSYVVNKTNEIIKNIKLRI